MDWFKEEWLKEDHKALGVYLALLYARFEFPLSYTTPEFRNRYYKERREQIAKTVYSFYKGKELNRDYGNC